MVLSISNISLQNCYSESFTTNSYVSLKTWKSSSMDVFPYTVYTHQPHMTYRCATFTMGMDSSFIIHSKCLPIQKDVSLSNSLLTTSLAIGFKGNKMFTQFVISFIIQPSSLFDCYTITQLNNIISFFISCRF